jgi:hypothetical protein
MARCWKVLLLIFLCPSCVHTFYDSVFECTLACHGALTLHSTPKQNTHRELEPSHFQLPAHSFQAPFILGAFFISLTVMHASEGCRRVLLPMAAFGTCKLVNDVANTNQLSATYVSLEMVNQTLPTCCLHNHAWRSVSCACGPQLPHAFHEDSIS